MSDSMDIVSDKQQQVAQRLAGGASEDAAEAASSQAAASATASTAASAAAGTASSAPATSGKKRAAWNTPTYRDEMDKLQSRFADQSFNAADYGDPLTTVRPLRRFYEREFPGEELQVFAQLEAEVDEHLARVAGAKRQ